MTPEEALQLIVKCQPVLDWLHDAECLHDTDVIDAMVGSVCPTGLLEVAMFAASHVLENGK